MCLLSQHPAGWWFGTVFIFPYIGNVIIPTEFHFFRGVGIPPTSQGQKHPTLDIVPSFRLMSTIWKEAKRLMDDDEFEDWAGLTDPNALEVLSKHL